MDDQIGFSNEEDIEEPNMEECEESAPPAVTFELFSKQNDINYYNCCVIPQGAINIIVNVDFTIRKELINVKMQGLSASMSKMDLNYELASKMQVYTTVQYAWVSFCNARMYVRP